MYCTCVLSHLFTYKIYIVKIRTHALKVSVANSDKNILFILSVPQQLTEKKPADDVPHNKQDLIELISFRLVTVGQCS